MLKIKRVYEAAAADDGQRYLVERLWPRGIKKSALELTAWLKELAPSTELRRWFDHDPLKWPEFQERYRAELEAKPAAWAELQQAAEQGNVTLLYSAHDTEHNNALALKLWLETLL